MANVLDSDIKVYEFELQLHNNVHLQIYTLGKGMDFLSPLAVG